MSKIKSTEPAYGLTLDNGSSWLVIRWHLQEACPDIVSIAEDAGNITQRTAQQPSDVELLKPMHMVRAGGLQLNRRQ